jgi:hypothetical protein
MYDAMFRFSCLGFVCGVTDSFVVKTCWIADARGVWDIRQRSGGEKARRGGRHGTDGGGEAGLS